MSAQDPRPASRRRKLVLRKIADGPAGTSSTGRTADSIARSAPTLDSAARSLAPSDSAVPTMPVAARTSSGTRMAVAARTDSSGRISEGASRTPPAPSSSSYSGPLSTLHHSPQTPMPMKSRPDLRAYWETERGATEPEPAHTTHVAPVEPEEAEADEEAELLTETPSHDLQSMEAWPASDPEAWSSSDDGAVAAMTPRAPSPLPTTVRSTPAWSASPPGPAQPVIAMPSLERTVSFPPPLAAMPGRPGDAGKRTSVAPVVASLPPMEMGPRLEPTRRRLSADSKLLAAGGALAAAMLLVALGVLLGQRSTRSETSSSAASAQYPVVVATKAPGATAMPAAAPVVEAHPAAIAATAPAATAPAKNDVTATVDVQQLPAAPRPRPQGWTVVAAAPKAASGAGWTVAPSPAAHPAAAKAVDPDTQAAAVEPSDPAAASASAAAPEAPAASASAAPPVDPLVQAVREDIREDEARTK